MNKMDPSDDEDVILPNSPLYEYFEEPTSKAKNLDKACFEGSITSKRVSIFDGFKRVANHISSPFYEVFDTCFSGVQEHLCAHHIKTQINTFEQVASFINDNGLMIPEDVTLLNNFRCNVTENKSRNSESTRWTHIILFFSYFNSLLYVLLYANYDYVTYDISDSILLGRKFMLLLATSVVSFVSYYGLLCLGHLFKCYIFKRQLKKLCTDVKCLHSLIRMSLRIVEEQELIVRGFMSASAAHVAQRLELSSALPMKMADKQLPELRKALFVWGKTLLMEYRNGMRHMLNMLPIPIDNLCSCIATMDLTELGDFLKYNPLVSEAEYLKLCKTTDNLSLAFLKALNQLIECQISEFLCRLCLSIACGSNGQVNYIDTFEKLSISTEILKKLDACSSIILVQVKQAYSYHQSQGSLLSNTDTSETRPSVNATFNLNSLVHDLTLHLKSALVRAVAVENLLNVEMDKSKSEKDISKLLAKELLVAFKSIQSSISFSDDYCNMCLTFLERDTKPVEEYHPIVDIPKTEAYNATCEDVKSIASVPYEVVDEVFEAYASDADATSNARTQNDEVFRNEVDKQTAIYLLKELKSVLQVKAEEHRIREEKVLRAKAGIDEQSQSTDKNNEHDVSEEDHSRMYKPSETKKLNYEKLEMIGRNINKSKKIESPQEIDTGSNPKDDVPTNSAQPSPFMNLLAMKKENIASAVAMVAANRQKHGVQEETIEYCDEDVIED